MWPVPSGLACTPWPCPDLSPLCRVSDNSAGWPGTPFPTCSPPHGCWYWQGPHPASTTLDPHMSLGLAPGDPQGAGDPPCLEHRLHQRMASFLENSSCLWAWWAVVCDTCTPAWWGWSTRGLSVSGVKNEQEVSECAPCGGWLLSAHPLSEPGRRGPDEVAECKQNDPEEFLNFCSP